MYIGMPTKVSFISILYPLIFKSSIYVVRISVWMLLKPICTPQAMLICVCDAAMDISSDLTALGRTPIAVISAGVKSILDIPKTLEYLVYKSLVNALLFNI